MIPDMPKRKVVEHTFVAVTNEVGITSYVSVRNDTVAELGIDPHGSHDPSKMNEWFSIDLEKFASDDDDFLHEFVAGDRGEEMHDRIVEGLAVTRGDLIRNHVSKFRDTGDTAHVIEALKAQINMQGGSA